MLVKLLAACLVMFVIGRMSAVYMRTEKQSTDISPRFAKGVEVTPPSDQKRLTRRSLGDVAAGVDGEDRRPISQPLCGLGRPCKQDEMAIGLASGPDTDSASICVDGFE
jgi:hypothetical protein